MRPAFVATAFSALAASSQGRCSLPAHLAFHESLAQSAKAVAEHDALPDDAAAPATAARRAVAARAVLHRLGLRFGQGIRQGRRLQPMAELGQGRRGGEAQGGGQPGEDELALGQTLASAESPPILLLLDELDRAGAGFSGLVRSALRGWVRDGRLQIVAASAESLDRAAPDLQATLLQLTLPPMPEREARSLVSELAQRASLELSASAVSDIIGVAGGYPARIQRALELWTQSEGGQTFDWRRTFREHHPEQAVLDSSLHGFAAVAETQAAEPKAASAPSRATLRERIRDSQKPQPRSYRADDPSEFLWMIILLALAIGVWWAIGSWWGVFGFAATLLGWIGIAWALVRFGGDRWRSSLYVSATRVLPLVGRFAPR